VILVAVENGSPADLKDSSRGTYHVCEPANGRESQTVSGRGKESRPEKGRDYHFISGYGAI